jgi:hypothetical protein
MPNGDRGLNELKQQMYKKKSVLVHKGCENKGV